MKYFVAIAILVALLSCRKEVHLKLPSAEMKPVAYCYISPQDSIISLSLSLAAPLYIDNGSNLFKPVTDANIIITSNQGSGALIYNNTTEKYELKTNVYPIIEGRTYALKVTLTNGTISEASTSVPFNTIKIKSAETSTNAINTTTIISCIIKYIDDINYSNYYCFYINSLDTSGTDTISYFVNYREISKDASYNGIENGMNIKLIDSISVKKAIGFKYYLLNCSKEYYDFYNYLNNYYGDSPFTEPHSTYTNFKGGYGVFASYSYDRRTVFK